MPTLQGFRPTALQRFVENNPNTVPLDILGDTLYEHRKSSSNITVGSDSTIASSKSQLKLTFTGFFVKGFAEDWYDRIHLIPFEIDFQNAFKPITKEFSVWNAFRIPQTLNTISYSIPNAVLIDTTPDSVPTYYGALRIATYQAQLLVTAPPVIDVKISIAFTDETVILPAIGRKLILWGLAPEVGHTETLEWKTDILSTFAGEQRLSIRSEPRQSFDYNYLLDPLEFAKQKSDSSLGAEKLYGVPVWTDAIYIGQMPSGQLLFNGDFVNHEFTLDGLVAVYGDGDDVHITEVVALTASTLTLRLPVLTGAADAFIVPLRIANSFAGPKFSRTASQYTSSQITFAVTDNSNYLKDAQPVIYQGADVLTVRYAVVNSITERIYRQLDVFDNDAGIINVDVQRGLLRNLQTVGFIVQAAEAKRKLRSWLMTRKGRLRPFWLPSWNPDVEIVTPVSSTATSIEIRACGFALSYGSKYLMVNFKNGTFHFLKVTSSLYVDGDTFETLILSQASGLEFTVDSISFICFMSHCRLDTDKVTIAHSDAGKLSTSLAVIEIPE